jgi:GAF domain-containing protein
MSGADSLSQGTSPDFLSGGGNMGAAIRSHDWNQTVLGAPQFWPQSLRSALSICLESQFQIAIYWGKELSLLYNDSWSQIPGDKHPWALGQPAREVWPEIRETVEPLLSGVLTTGQATCSKDALLAMHRRGFREECYFDCTFSPIRDEAGGVGGIFHIAIETTFRVLEERRQRLVRDLREATGRARTAEEICRLASSVFSAYCADVPFCLFYLMESTREPPCIRLIARTGAPEGAVDDFPWPISELKDGSGVLVEDLCQRTGKRLPGGPWPEPCDKAFVAPIPGPGSAEFSGVLVAGISPRLMFDLEYRSFLERIAGSLAADIARARAYEEERRLAKARAEIDRAKTTFLSNISHEFRTPLTLMLGPLNDALQQEGRLSGSGREQLELARRNGMRLQKLVNTLLDFSRIEAGRVRANYEPTNLGAFTAELASTFRSACARAGLELIVDCSGI